MKKNLINKRLLLNTSRKLFAEKFKPMFFKDLTLKETDPEIYELIQKEKERQFIGLELIASENYASRSVLEICGSVLSNKYSEGQPGARYYGGNQYIDQLENLAKKRALQAFKLNPDHWGANVQAFSGSPANFSIYTALLEPGERLLGMHLYSGGHLTHGFRIEGKNISASAKFFSSDFYYVDEKTGIIDYEGMEKKVLEFKPKILICGGSCYNRDIDYARFRKAADSVGAYLMADIAHTAGLIAGGELSSPFEFADIVVTTTHKSLRGPRGSIIFSNKGKHPDISDKIDFAVFPMLQGGPHNYKSAAIAAQMKEVMSPQFKEYAAQVRKNARRLEEGLIKGGNKVIGKTENHLVVWDVRPWGLTGNKVQKGLDLVHITTNKNTIVGDKSAMNPGGVRLGTCALTTRGMKENEMDQVAEFLTRFSKIGSELSKSHKKVNEFEEAIKNNSDMIKLGDDVKKFSTQYAIPSVDDYSF
jgi:glycine hydroxymethyltransferase